MIIPKVKHSTNFTAHNLPQCREKKMFANRMHQNQKRDVFSITNYAHNSVAVGRVVKIIAIKRNPFDTYGKSNDINAHLNRHSGEIYCNFNEKCSHECKVIDVTENSSKKKTNDCLRHRYVEF